MKISTFLDTSQCTALHWILVNIYEILVEVTDKVYKMVQRDMCQYTNKFAIKSNYRVLNSLWTKTESTLPVLKQQRRKNECCVWYICRKCKHISHFLLIINSIFACTHTNNTFRTSAAIVSNLCCHTSKWQFAMTNDFMKLYIQRSL